MSRRMVLGKKETPSGHPKQKTVGNLKRGGAIGANSGAKTLVQETKWGEGSRLLME